MAGRFDPKESGYVEVNKRIESFKEAHPDGSLQSEVVEFGEDIVIMKAYAYRHPDDSRPGIGHSMMNIPGTTPYTRGSEVENAETSAWGRAIAALGFEVHKAIASAEEVAMKAGEETSETVAVPDDTLTVLPPAGTSSKPATAAQKRKLMSWGKKLLGDESGVRKFVYISVGKSSSADLTHEDMDALFTQLQVVEDTRTNSKSRADTSGSSEALDDTSEDEEESE